ncbi:hypothetical protein [Halocola ammonii]
MIRIPATLLLLFLVLNSFGQDEGVEEDVKLIYNSQFAGGLSIHTNGAGGFFYLGKYKGIKNVWTFGLDILYMKHEKEIKSYNPVYEDSRGYVYGKLNNFYIFRPTIGQKHIITEKIRQKGVQVGFHWQVGPSLGVTKPVYLEIGYPSIPYDSLQVERYDPERHDIELIYGKASGFRGLSELKLYPGAFAKFAFNFEYSNENDRIKGIEVGVAMDAYLREIPIMAESEVANNRQLFTTLFLNFFFGKKYTAR